MGGAVVAGEPGAVHAEQNRQLLQRHIVNDRVERALEECGVNGAHGAKTARGHPGGEDDGVLLGDAHVEVALGMMRPEEVESGAVGHGSGDGHNTGILIGQIGEGVGKGFRPGLVARGKGLAGLGIVRTQPVKLLLQIQGGLEAAALLRQNMEQDGMIQILEKPEGLHQKGQVVAVDGPVVLEPELLKKHRGPEHALGSFLGTADHLDGGLATDLLAPPSGRNRADAGSARW